MDLLSKAVTLRPLTIMVFITEGFLLGMAMGVYYAGGFDKVYQFFFERFYDALSMSIFWFDVAFLIIFFGCIMFAFGVLGNTLYRLLEVGRG